MNLLESHPEYIYAAAGALMQELMHLYELRQDLGKTVKISSSWQYWLVTIAMMALSTFFAPEIVGTLKDSVFKEGLINPESSLGLMPYTITAFIFPILFNKIAKITLNTITRSAEDGVVTKSGEKRSFKGMDYFK